MHILKRVIASPTMHPNAHIDFFYMERFMETSERERERVSEMHHFVLGDFTLILIFAVGSVQMMPAHSLLHLLESSPGKID